MKHHLEMAPAPTSFVVYRGPSMLDGAPIVAILTATSRNVKTGPMAQLFIMHANVAPTEAQRTGDDASVCGDCPFRPITARANGTPECYVIVYQGPLSTWKANRNKPVNLGGALSMLTTKVVSVRLGAYGDPAALPPSVIKALSEAVDGRTTGYTHQWRKPENAWLKSYLMASADDVCDYARATAEGWRTYRVLADDKAPLAKREILCPSEIGVQCIDCGLCDGKSYGSEDNRKSIAIVAH